jgi:Flp pilus assembly protein TadD/lysophospholipase L1-like esterase
LLFALVACTGFLLLIELVLALAGIKPLLFERDPYVGFTSIAPLFVKDSADAGFLVTAPNKRRHFNLQRFPARKAAGAYRIFCIGGSTTYGHPYADPTSFCGWLREMLPVADPSRRWELINCGGISYATYREALLMEELVHYEPDLFIILTGHNEFLEARTYSNIIQMPTALRGAGALLNRTRTGTALRMALDKLRHAPAAAPASNALPAEVETILERVAGPQAYHRDEAGQKSILDHYRFNLARMVDIAASAGAKVIFISPASSLRNCAPFKSEHRPGMTEAELRAWNGHFSRATQAAQAGHWTDCLAALDQAGRLDDRHAGLHYLRGEALWKLERFPEARSAYIRARDEDICPLRALSRQLDSMGEIAAYRGAELVNFSNLLEERSAHGVPGDDWFLDHVHPTIEGNHILALALLDKLFQRGTARPRPAWNEAAALEIKRTVEARITPKEHGEALCTLAKVIAWAGKHGEALNISLRAVALAPDDPEVRFEAGKNAAHVGRNDDAVPQLQRALELRPAFVEARSVLASVYAAQGRADDAIRELKQAITLRPQYAELHCNLGGLLQQHGRLDEAASSLREALRLAPNYAEAHNNLGWALKNRGDFTEAVAHFREADRLKPGLPSPLLGLAWLLAAHPETAHRNPAEAVRIGERLAELSEFRNWMALDTLATAYAAAGRFEEAARTARKALELVQTASPTNAPAVSQRVMLFEQRQPFVEVTKRNP